MFKTRLLSGIVLVIILLFFLITGGALTWGFTGVISLIGLYELFRVFGIEKKGIGFLGYICAIAYFILLYLGLTQYVMMLLIGYLLLLMAWFVLPYPAYSSEQMIAAFFGFVYVPVMLSYVYQTRAGADGQYLVWLLVLSSWGCDTCAYCAGRLLGKHKLSPILSPKKSVEGAIGGVIGSLLLGIIYGAVFASRLTAFANPILACALICAGGAAASQIGDLTASGIKRAKGIKDYGNLIPGHGGIMDRFDSMIVTAPMIYYLIVLLAQV